MERLYLEIPSLKRKEEAVDYIEEHVKYKSNINGSGSLDKYVLDEDKNYESWLKYLENMKIGISEFVPSSTYFLIRESDDKIIGMINIRHNLNEMLLTHGGHIGYGIRPLERKKRYNKINLYLGLLECEKLGIDKVLLTAYEDNIGSIKTIKALGGRLENKIKEKSENTLLSRYWIDVKKSLEKNKETYI